MKFLIFCDSAYILWDIKMCVRGGETERVCVFVCDVIW